MTRSERSRVTAYSSLRSLRNLVLSLAAGHHLRKRKVGAVAHACGTNTWELKAGASGVCSQFVLNEAMSQKKEKEK